MAGKHITEDELPVGGTTGQVLKKTSNADYDLEWGTGGAGASALDDLTDVTLTAPSNGQVLKYNGSAWINDTDATGGGGVSDGDKGDITISGSGTTYTIDNDVVTYAKMQNVSATDRVLGRDTAGAGDVEEISPTDLRTMINVANGATANSSDATLLDRTNHTGTQASTTISDFDEAVEDKIGAKVKAGTGISVSYNDGTGETTVTSTAGDVYTTVGSSGATYTTIAAAITAGATKIAVLTNVTETVAVTLAADGVIIGLNQSITVTMPSGGDFTLGARARISEITITLDTGKFALGADASASRVVLNKSSATGYLLELTGVRASFSYGRIYDTSTTLSTTRVIMRQYAQKFEGNYCEIADCATTAANAWFRTSNIGGDTGAVHIISKNYFYSSAAWAVGAVLMNLQYADGSISENKFEGPVSRGVAIKIEDYHETVMSNYFVNFETQLLIPETGSPTYNAVYRVEVLGNRFASASGRSIDITGYANSIIGNTVSGTNQTIRISPSTSGATYGYGNIISGNQIRSSNIVLGANSQNNIITNNTFLSSASVTDSGTGNKFWLNEGGPADNVLDTDLTTIAALTPSNDDFLQRKAGAWANRTVSQVKTDLGLTGTNSGDQTSIVGISGTKAEFNTAVSDGDIAFLDGTPTFTTDVSVPDEAYGVGWNGSVEVPTKNAVYDKIETLAVGDVTGPAGATDNQIPRFLGATGKSLDASSVIIDDSGNIYTGYLTLGSDGNVTVVDEAYGAGWNGDLTVPSKNAVYDKIETLGSSGASLGQVIAQAAGLYNY